jgi:hypothetical protein
MSNTASGLTGAKDQDTENKKNLVQLEEMAKGEESNPTVLNHAKKAIPSCDYKNKNLVWDGSAWKCVTMNVDTECQAAAPDEYMYKDSNGNTVCAKSPKGSSISYYYEFRTYTTKCVGASQGYEKLYDCKYTNKLGDKIQVADSYCAGKSKPSIAKKACKRAWTTGTWGTCSKTCGGGTQTRSVYCQSGYDCSSYAKPTNTATCNTQKCKGDWVTSAWSSCSVTACGKTGKQTRTVYCPTNLDCSDKPKPTTTQTCSTRSCPSWTVGQWSACSKTCGTGSQTRTVTCKDTSCVGTKPATSQTCNTQKCTTNWVVGSWSACSAKACGTNGTQTRSVYCPSGFICNGVKPATTQACSAGACSYTYSWSYGNFSTCSASACGTGTQTRSYKCVRSDGTTVSNSYCSGSPVYQKSCTVPCNSCIIKHPIGWDGSFGSSCVEYYQPAGKGFRTSQLPHNATMTYFSSYGGQGSITIKCNNGNFTVTSKKCSGKIGGITESIK